jgi:hypothetical protein
VPKPPSQLNARKKSASFDSDGFVVLRIPSFPTCHVR